MMKDDFILDTFILNKDLVAVHIDAANSIDVINHLSELFIQHGYVKPSFPKAVILREKSSPTGLPTPGIGTAIPHAEVEHAIKPGIAVATLSQPVKWGKLGDPDNEIDVSIVFMLSVTVPSTQVYLLQSLVEIYKDKSLLLKVQATKDPGVIVEEVNHALEKVNAEKNGE